MTTETEDKPCIWSFAGVVFDERAWVLTVDGHPVALERKPLAVLQQLLRCAGEKVTKEHLMETVWPGIFVAEASLTTAMRKLREAIGDDRRDNRIIETVSGIGYRLSVPVERKVLATEIQPWIHANATPASEGSNGRSQNQSRHSRPYRFAGVAALVALVAGAIAVATTIAPPSSQTGITRPVDQKQVLSAIRRLDLDKIEAFNAVGWDPNKPFNTDGNGALHMALEVCEWDPAHDKQKLLLLVRLLYDGGAKTDMRNKWGDTPYSIASAKRYCGPDHPVTKMLYRDCFGGEVPLGDRCIATYELERRAREADG